MTTIRIIALFLIAAIAEIGGCWLIRQAVREHRSWSLAVGGMLALAAYGLVATAQPDSHFGRVLAAYGGIFVAGSLTWGVLFDGFTPSRWDLLGAAVCLIGVGVIMLAPQALDRTERMLFRRRPSAHPRSARPRSKRPCGSGLC